MQQMQNAKLAHCIGNPCNWTLAPTLGDCVKPINSTARHAKKSPTLPLGDILYDIQHGAMITFQIQSVFYLVVQNILWAVLADQAF